MPPLKDLLPFITFKFLIPAVIISGIILFAPDIFIAKVGVESFKKAHDLWIGIFFLSTLALLLGLIVEFAIKAVGKRINVSKSNERKRRRLHNLSEKEKNILKAYFIEGVVARNLDPLDYGVTVLLKEGILIEAATFGHVVYGFPYRIDDYCRLCIIDSPHILGERIGHTATANQSLERTRTAADGFEV